ncbi:MAG: two-component sensor histidine kinase [Lachnospiraceae bacterium]|nr:two-component sensor histidine kinase [Lachnospiraceae bacterium]
MKKTMNVRFMIISAAAILITALISTILFFHILKRQVFADLQAYEHVISQVDPSMLEISKEEMRVTVIAEDGEVLFDSQANAKEMENHKDRPEIQAARRYGVGEKVRWSDTFSVHTFYYAALMEDGSVLRVAKQSTSLYDVMKNTIMVIVVIAVITFILCAVAAHLLTRRMIEPIERMAHSLLVLEEDNVYEEIRPFVKTIKEQHMNILNHAKLRQEFTANVSHELKTPLTAISGYAELIENGMVQQEDMGRFAGQIQKNANRLLNLINDIMKLSELDSEEMEIPFEKFDLYDLAENTMHMMELPAQKQDVELIFSGEHVEVNGGKSLIEELIYNLISNAIRYNVKGGRVYIKVEVENEHPVLVVEDTGIGISKEHQERIFERFYRVDKSRSKSTGGTGLGLAIVKHIIAQHDAAITVESEEGKGTKMKVIFG